MQSLSLIRQHFLNFFESQGHRAVPSSPLVPQNDPTLMFTAAGMVQFKNYFTGLETPAYPRAVSVQKCVRAGGKHNDLENVGYTSRHHTFFEMLGNFSFGDYFKEEAITMAWQFVHHELNLPKDRLLVTVYSEDHEARILWKKIAGLPDNRIISISTADNFWSMGDTGPCGPCSEIFYDHGPSVEGGPPGSADEDGDRFMEIWNLVFMQYEQRPDGRVLLPRPSIDTGSGLERLTAVLQGVHSNYEIDLFKNLITAFQEEAKVKATADTITSFRVLADHLRASSFLLADGVTPSNEGRGYVLRRIMRRAMRHAYLLGVNEPLMYRLVPFLVHEMQDAYPELSRAQGMIIDVLKQEETRFRETLGRGLKLLDEEAARLPLNSHFPGETAFKLYDTYGFPLDLTQDILRGQNRQVDLAGFQQAMEAQKAEARKSWAGSGGQQDDAVWFQQRETIPATEFLGYDKLETEAKVMMIVVNNTPKSVLAEGDEGWVVMNQTPFYAESGGQMGDKGTITTPSGFKGEVTNTLNKANGYYAHHVRALKGQLILQEPVSLKVDALHRQGLKNHHSATHLLHAVLRQLLGDQIVQKGSLVATDRLRFDFSCSTALEGTQLTKIENEVNRLIRANTPTITRVMAASEALQTGGMALFGEKYADQVRVISMGEKHKDCPYSMELCGGTHVARTGDIGYFKILSEGGVAAGIRRIEAVAGQAAETYVQSVANLVKGLADDLRVAPDNLQERIAALMAERKLLEKEVRLLQQKIATTPLPQDSLPQEKVAGLTFIHRLYENIPVKDLKGIAENLRGHKAHTAVIVGAKVEDKVSIVAALSLDVASRVSAVDLVKCGAKYLAGQGGGGRPDMAQAGGSDASAWGKAIQEIKNLMIATLGE